jgi:hypothetical protein
LRTASRVVGALLFYLVLAIVLTFPLVSSLSTVVPHDYGDPVLNTWILWWNAHTPPLSAAWWTPPAFFPSAGALAFSEHLLGLAPLTTPIQWLGASPLAAYNVAFLLSFPLCAVAAYLLVLQLTGRHDAAFVAGLAYGFAPYRIAHLPHLQMLSAYWMPIALIGLHRFARDRRAGWLALFGGAWLLQSASNGYFLFFFSIVVALWLLWFLPPWREMRAFLAVVCAWLVAALPLVPLLTGYRMIQQGFGMRRGIDEVEAFSADVLSLLNASPLLAFWHLSAFHWPEGELFPGLTVVACLAAGAVVALLASRAETGETGSGRYGGGRLLRGIRITFVVVAIVGALAAASALVIGTWHARVLGLSISVTRPDKPLSFTFVSLLGLLLTSHWLQAAARRCSQIAFYLVAAGVSWLLCLGPSPHAFGARIWYKAPYAWLMLVPGFDAVRVPARFAMMIVLCLSVVVGLIVARLAPRAGRWRLALIGLIAAGLIADGWITRLPLFPEPAHGDVLAGASPVVPVLELPACDVVNDAAAEYRTMFRQSPTVNGYSGYMPRHYELLCLALKLRDPGVLTELASLRGELNIIIDEHFDADGAWAPYLSEVPDVTRVRSGGGQVLYHLAASKRAAVGPHGRSLAMSSISTRPEGTGARGLTDGDPWTSWVAPTPQQGNEEVVVDLGSPQQVQAIELALGPLLWNFPRKLIVDSSVDGRQWAQGWAGPTAPLALRSALEDERNLPLTIDIGERQARFVRLRQVGHDDKYPWSIAELAVLAPKR